MSWSEFWVRLFVVALCAINIGCQIVYAKRLYMEQKERMADLARRLNTPPRFR